MQNQPLFQTVTRNEVIPGYRLAYKREVEAFLELVKPTLERWTIATLQDGWKIAGRGYQYDIAYMGQAASDLGHKVLIKHYEKIVDIRKFLTSEVSPPGWRLATVEEVEERKEHIVTLLDRWDIVKLWGGWKIDGAGYGNKILYDGPDKSYGHQLLVLPQEDLDDLHETYQGHSMHPFHGRPPNENMTARYSPSCRVCNKEALENDPYFMHCYERQYDVCTSCSKFEIHFDQLEETKCSNNHPMKIHRGYVNVNNEAVVCQGTSPVSTIEGVCRHKNLHEAPYFFHCAKCNENKCITCSRHDPFIRHQSAQFMDTEDNFVQVMSEFNTLKKKNQLSLYEAQWDSGEGTPSYVRDIEIIRLDSKRNRVTFDDHETRFETDSDTFKEFILDVVPLAKLCHTRIEFYNTDINKGGYPVDRDESERVYCGRKHTGGSGTCSGDSQCEHCEHYTAKEKETNGNRSRSLLSGIGNFLGGVLDTIPVVGHVKGIVEYATGHKDAAKKSFEMASRTTAVMGAGAAGFVIGGPVGAIGAGVAAGTLFDAAESGIDSSLKGKWTPHGEMEDFTKLMQGKASVWNLSHLGMDIVFDGMTGADGGAIVKGMFEDATEKGMAGEIGKDVSLPPPEETKPPLLEFPPELRREYILRDHHWTPRAISDDDPMFKEIYEELKRLPKDDLDIIYGERPSWVEDVKPWWSYENVPGLKNDTIKKLRTQVNTRLPSQKRCAVKKTIVKPVVKSMPMSERRNVDHIVECQLVAKVSRGLLVGQFSPADIDVASDVIKSWLNSDKNLMVVSAQVNIQKRDAFKAAINGESSVKNALQTRGLSSAEASFVRQQITKSLKELTKIANSKTVGIRKIIERFTTKVNSTIG